MSLDAWSFHPQIPDITDLARSLPYANIIMGHCGGPLGYGRHAGKPDEVFADWKKSITELAKCPNVTNQTRRHDDASRSVRLHGDGGAAIIRTTGQCMAAVHPNLYRTVGANRCIVESNFPVEKMGIGYAALFNALKRLAAGGSADERQQSSHVHTAIRSASGLPIGLLNALATPAFDGNARPTRISWQLLFVSPPAAA